MYIHIGNNALLKTDEIIGIFDLDTSTVSVRTRNFLKKAEKRGDVILAATDLPKSFVVASKKRGDTRVYLSQLAPSTLCKREI